MIDFVFTGQRQQIWLHFIFELWFFISNGTWDLKFKFSVSRMQYENLLGWWGDSEEEAEVLVS